MWTTSSCQVQGSGRCDYHPPPGPTPANPVARGRACSADQNPGDDTAGKLLVQASPPPFPPLVMERRATAGPRAAAGSP